MKNKRIGIGLWLASMVCSCAAGPSSLETLYPRARAASLEILVEGQLGGSGWLSPKAGVAVTAAHVVHDPNRRLELLTPDGQRLPTEVIAVDFAHDLCLLKVPESLGAGLPLAKALPVPGAPAYLYGAPVFRHHVLLKGSLARPDPAVEWNPVLKGYGQVYYFTGPSPIGSSGGMWINAQGEVIGLQSGMMQLNNAPQGIAFVSGIDAIRALLERPETRATPTLGCATEELWESGGHIINQYAPHRAGLVVRLLQSGKAAENAGLKDGDLILALDGKPATHRDAFNIILQSTRSVGDRIELHIFRRDESGGRELNVRVTLESMEGEGW